MCATPIGIAELVYIMIAIQMCQPTIQHSLVQSQIYFPFWVDVATSFKHCAAAVVTISTQRFETKCSMPVNQSNILTATQKHSNRQIPLISQLSTYNNEKMLD